VLYIYIKTSIKRNILTLKQKYAASSLWRSELSCQLHMTVLTIMAVWIVLPAHYGSLNCPASCIWQFWPLWQSELCCQLIMAVWTALPAVYDSSDHYGILNCAAGCIRQWSYLMFQTNLSSRLRFLVAFLISSKQTLWCGAFLRQLTNIEEIPCILWNHEVLYQFTGFRQRSVCWTKWN
jgi:hypothetical protein